MGDNQLQKTVFIAHFSEKLGIPLNQLEKNAPAPVRLQEIRAQEVRPNNPEHLPLKQKQLLEFLIIFPEYLQKFLEAGIEDVVVSNMGRNILTHLLTYFRGGNNTLDQLLDLAEGPEKAFISRLLINSPSYSDDDREEIAAEKTAWLKKNRHTDLKESLTRQIKAAQQAGDDKLLMELMARKIDLTKEAD
jgi:hypothetical protein